MKHHRQFPIRILQLNAKNHVFLYLKNFPSFSWRLFVREFFYWSYALVAETRTLGVLPEFFSQLSLIWKKRLFIKRTRKINRTEFERMLV